MHLLADMVTPANSTAEALYGIKVATQSVACPTFSCLQEELLKEWDEVPAVFLTSSREGEGRQQLMHYIAQLRMLFTGEALPKMKMLTVARVEQDRVASDDEIIEHIPDQPEPLTQKSPA